MQNPIYIILLLSFVVGSYYNLEIRKQSIYNIKLTKTMIALLAISVGVLLVLAYIGGNTLKTYLLGISASVLIVSGVSAQGIHRSGIYHLYGRGILPKLAKWEDIESLDIDKEKNKLKSLRIETKTMGVNQYYSPEAIGKLNEYL